MASVNIHNVKSVEITGNTHEDFCTLHLDVTTESEYTGLHYERLEFFFDTTADRKAFVEAISAGGF